MGHILLVYYRLSTIHFYIILKQRKRISRWLVCLSTIHFYIILKQICIITLVHLRLSTIHFYIILKLSKQIRFLSRSLSTIHFYIILKLEHLHQTELLLLEYHTFLHHSQTDRRLDGTLRWLEYHTFLHHSQTFRCSFPAFLCLSTIHFYIILKLQYAQRQTAWA